MPNRIIQQLEAAREGRRRRREFTDVQRSEGAVERSQSLPAIRIVTTFTDEEVEDGNMQKINPHTPDRQHESQEEDELERLRAQIQADSKSQSATTRKTYSMSALQHEHDAAFASLNSSMDGHDNSRVSAQRALSGPPVVPDSATFAEQERVMRRFPTAPARKSPPMQPVQLHVDEDDTPGVGTDRTDTKARLFCGIPANCYPDPPQTAIPGIEMQESFKTLFEPLNDRARQFFGAAAKEADDGVASAITEPFDNRSLHRNATWSSYLGTAWSFQTNNSPQRQGTPTSVAHVPGQTISPVASHDEMDPSNWDTNHIAQRMEQSLKMAPSTILEEDNDTTASVGGGSSVKSFFTSPPQDSPSTVRRLPFFPADPEPKQPSTPESMRTKYASELPKELVKTQRLGAPKKPLKKPLNDDFWSDLLAEGVIEPDDLSPRSRVSSGEGIEIINCDV